jgi:hypothetical protein
MKRWIVLLSIVVAGCSAGVVITNAPSSLGNCMPEKPAGGCP